MCFENYFQSTISKANYKSSFPFGEALNPHGKKNAANMQRLKYFSRVGTQTTTHLSPGYNGIYPTNLRFLEDPLAELLCCQVQSLLPILG